MHVIEGEDVETSAGFHMLRFDDNVQQHLPEIRGSRLLHRQQVVDNRIQRDIHLRHFGSANIVPSPSLLRSHCW